MSDLIVKVNQIKDIRPHNNADALELAIVDGWQVVVQKGMKPGDEVIFVPPDSMIPWDVAKSWGVDKYLNGYGSTSPIYKEAGRVKAIRLRGEASLGFIIPNQGFDVGMDVKDNFGIFKFIF